MKDGVYPSISCFFSAEEEEVSSLVLKRLKEEEKGEDIAVVLAVCRLVMLYGGGMKAALRAGGLAASLVKILESHRGQVDVAERGLWSAAEIACYDGK